MGNEFQWINEFPSLSGSEIWIVAHFSVTLVQRTVVLTVAVNTTVQLHCTTFTEWKDVTAYNILANSHRPGHT